MSALLAALAGAATGVLSSWGVGGGTLLIIYMTVAAGIEQQTAQGINLMYFVPASLTALISHIKNRLIDKSAVIPAIITGVPVTLASALLSSLVSVDLMRKIFAAFLIITGVSEIFRKGESKEK